MNSSTDKKLEKYLRSIRPSTYYFDKLSKVVEHYTTNHVDLNDATKFVSLDEDMFDNGELDDGDIIIDGFSKTFAIVIGSGHGRVLLYRISRHPRELEQIKPLYSDNVYPHSHYKVIVNKITGGKSRKSRKSKKSIKMRKARKSRKSRKARKSRKM